MEVFSDTDETQESAMQQLKLNSELSLCLAEYFRHIEMDETTAAFQTETGRIGKSRDEELLPENSALKPEPELMRRYKKKLSDQETMNELVDRLKKLNQRLDKREEAIRKLEVSTNQLAEQCEKQWNFNKTALEMVREFLQKKSSTDQGEADSAKVETRKAKESSLSIHDITDLADTSSGEPFYNGYSGDPKDYVAYTVLSPESTPDSKPLNKQESTDPNLSNRMEDGKVDHHTTKRIFKTVRHFQDTRSAADWNFQNRDQATNLQLVKYTKPAKNNKGSDDEAKRDSRNRFESIRYTRTRPPMEPLDVRPSMDVIEEVADDGDDLVSNKCPKGKRKIGNDAVELYATPERKSKGIFANVNHTDVESREPLYEMPRSKTNHKGMKWRLGRDTYTVQTGKTDILKAASRNTKEEVKRPSSPIKKSGDIEPSDRDFLLKKKSVSNSVFKSRTAVTTDSEKVTTIISKSRTQNITKNRVENVTSTTKGTIRESINGQQHKVKPKVTKPTERESKRAHPNKIAAMGKNVPDRPTVTNTRIKFLPKKKVEDPQLTMVKRKPWL